MISMLSDTWGSIRHPSPIRNTVSISNPCGVGRLHCKTILQLALTGALKSYEEANHPPVVVLGYAADMKEKPGTTVKLSAQGTSDPDVYELKYRCWQYEEADSYAGSVEIQNEDKQSSSFKVPTDAKKRRYHSYHLRSDR